MVTIVKPNKVTNNRFISLCLLVFLLPHKHLCLSAYLAVALFILSRAVFRCLWKLASRLHLVPLWIEDSSPVTQCPLHPQYTEASQQFFTKGFLHHTLER